MSVVVACWRAATVAAEDEVDEDENREVREPFLDRPSTMFEKGNIIESSISTLLVVGYEAEKKRKGLDSVFYLSVDWGALYVRRIKTYFFGSYPVERIYIHIYMAYRININMEYSGR